MSKHPIVYLEWLDSAGYEGWQDNDTACSCTPYHCRTAAFLLYVDDLHYVITQSETVFSDDAGFDQKYHGLFSIPKSAVTHIEYL